MSDAFEVWESFGSGTETPLRDREGTNGLSEHELLDIMYNSCETSNNGEVLASNIVHYLDGLTAQSAERERLVVLRQLLDPNQSDPHVNRDTFHSIMKGWISQCSQDRSDADPKHLSGTVHVGGLNLSFSEGKAETDQQSPCDEQDLSEKVSELKHAHRMLSERNSSLLRMLAQCEDVNMQLSQDITELQAKLDRAQRSALRARSLAEELEETRQVLVEVQETASHSQSTFNKLGKEIECLKVEIRRLEDKNEKLTVESTSAEDSLKKIKKANKDLKAKLEETLVVLMLREKDIKVKEIVMNKMKGSHAENHKMIEVLQSNLMTLQEHSHQVLMSYNRHCHGPLALHSFSPPNHLSLQSEIHQMQMQCKVLEKGVHTRSEDIQRIIRRIKKVETAQFQDNKSPEMDATTERCFPHRCQQQTSIKQQPVSVLQELDLHKGLWEEKGEECLRSWETETESQIQEDRKVAVVNWREAQNVDGVKSSTTETDFIHTLSETQADSFQAQQNITDMRENACHLQTSIRSEKECVKHKDNSRVLHVDEDNNTTEEKDQKDAAVYSESENTLPDQEQTEVPVTTDGLLATLRRMEAMVSSALETAELVKLSEQRVCQVREKMESISQKIEEALGRAVNSDKKINALEARITEKLQTQSPLPSLQADPGTDRKSLPNEAEPEQKNSTEHPFESPAVSASLEPPQLAMNGAAGHDGCSKLQVEVLSSFLEQSEKDFRPSSVFRVERPFLFSHTRSRCLLPHIMPTLPEEEEESPEERDSYSNSIRNSTQSGSQDLIMTAPTIIYPQQAFTAQQDGRALDQNRPHSPRARLARNSPGGSITTVDSTGNVIDLLKDQLPELQLSEEDRQKNLELLEQAKKVSEHFLTRRGRRSTSSLTESPPALSPSLTPSSSPCSSRSSSQILAPQTAPGFAESSQVKFQFPNQLPVRNQTELTNQDQEDQQFVDWKPTEKRKVSSGTLKPRFAVHKENCDPAVSKRPSAVNKADETSARNSNQAPATGVTKSVPRPHTQQVPCTAEIKTIGAFPPLMRAVSWDTVGGLNSRNSAGGFPSTADNTFSENQKEVVFKPSGYKDLPAQMGVQKLSKFREEHKLMRNQSIVGSKLPDVSEVAEQEKGPSCLPKSAGSEETKEKSDAMPNISDIMLRKLKLHRGLPGCAPPLTEKEVENAFVQLSLAFRNDNYTLETRVKQAERERNLTEEDTEKELEEFKGALKMTSPQWQNLEQREAYQRLIETVAVLHRLSVRLSSRAEIVGAVRQEKRMSKATEVMMQYVENLKRTYEKDHAELMEFKKLANQNSNRCYGPSVDTGDDGVPRPSRSMSLTMGKALPRRRVSVAVVPKFNLLNIPGQTPVAAGTSPSAGPTMGAGLPVLCEANDVKSSSTEATQPAGECGKSATEQESVSAKPLVNLEEIKAEIRAEIQAKIEEEAYNKGYQEGLKQNKTLLEEKSEAERNVERLLEFKNKDEESGKRQNSSRRMDEILALLIQFCPSVSISRRILWVTLMVFVVMCVVVSVFSFFSDYYSRREDT